MDTEQYNTIDFANSKSDTYNASSADVMSELNAYFKSYIANVNGDKEAGIQDTLDGILHGSTFDDALDTIHREHISSSSSSSSSSSESDAESDNENVLMDGIKNEVLDVEILDQHIDKHGLTGGSDATRAIENMAGGGLNAQAEELDDHDASDETTNDFANNMLGMNGGDVKVIGKGLMKGYSGVTNEIRVKGNRVTERNRNTFDYRDEDGRLDMGMLGGSFDDRDWTDPVTDTDVAPYPKREPSSEEEENIENGGFINGPGNTKASDDSDDEYYSQNESDEDEHVESNMASEIDLVLNQLRNKTARTLTGGTVNIRKKVVLTDMYPYIVRS